jgi:Protein phosphatase 2C
MGSRLAAATIVRQFCDAVLLHMNKDAMVTGSDLVEAARKTQISLDELARTLLSGVNTYVFDAVRGSDLQRATATRLLQNTLNPKVTSMPAALTATLIGGVVQPDKLGSTYRIELLRIGDGSVEHIDRAGRATPILTTDSEVMAISESMGPGPRSRALFEESGHRYDTKSLTLGPGESLIVSSDGLARGHQELISRKVAEVTGDEFWKTAQPEEVDAALQVLHQACSSADEVFNLDPSQCLFGDNVSMILIRSGD